MKKTNTELTKAIENRIQLKLKPKILEVIDESPVIQNDKNEEIESQNGCQNTHFLINIKSDSFLNKTLVEQHRMIYECINDIMPHSIRINIL